MLSFKRFQWNILDIQIKFKIHHIYHWRKKKGEKQTSVLLFLLWLEVRFQIERKGQTILVLGLNMFVHWLITEEGFHPRKIK